VALTTQPHLVVKLWMRGAIILFSPPPPPPMACYRVTFTFNSPLCHILDWSRRLDAFIFSPMHTTCPTYLFFFFDLNIPITYDKNKDESSSLCSFLKSYSYFHILRVKHFTQYLATKHPHTMFFTQCDMSSFKPIQNRNKIYNFRYLKLQGFR
jgi:hypothetical protein